MSDIRTPEVDALLEVFAHVTNPDDIFKLFEDLLTVREIKDTSQRLDVARMLKAGKSYTAIEQKTAHRQRLSRACRKRSTMARVGMPWRLEALDEALEDQE